MLTAQEAKIKSETVRKNNQLKEVEIKIKEAIIKGKTDITMPYLSDVTMEELRALGYEVTFYPGGLMCDDEYNVSW